MPIKFKNYDFLFLVVLVASLLVRLAGFDYPLVAGGGEPARDFFIASHVFEDGFLPIAGPSAGLIVSSNSPSYYYILKLFLLIKNDFVFLQYVNIILQLLTIIFIYLIVRILFGQPAALFSAILFAFAEKILWQSQYIWQPFVMQAFLYAGYLFLSIAYLRRKFPYLLLGLVIVTIASSLHLSAFSVLPMIFTLAFCMLTQWGATTKQYMITILTTTALLLVLFGPIILSESFMFLNGIGTQSIKAITYSSFWSDLLSGILSNMSSLLSIYIIQPNEFWVALIIAAVFMGIVYLKWASQEARVVFLSTVGLLLSPPIFLSVANAVAIKDFNIFYHHLTPSFGLVAILMVVPSSHIFFKNKIITGMTASVLLSLAVIVPSIGSAVSNLSDLDHGQNYDRLKEAASVIEIEIYDLKNKNRYNNLDFFQIDTYNYNVRSGHSYPMNSMFIWNIIQKDMSYEFVKVAHNRDGYAKPEYKDFVFLVCMNSLDSCFNDFLLQKKSGFGYTVVDNIYNNFPFNIFLLAHENKTKRLLK